MGRSALQSVVNKIRVLHGPNYVVDSLEFDMNGLYLTSPQMNGAIESAITM